MPTKTLSIFSFLLLMLMFSSSALSMKPALRNTILLSNALSIIGGVGLFSMATIDVIQDKSNRTDLFEVEKQVAATSLLLFGVGAALSLIACELSEPKLVNRMDQVAIAFTSFGFALVSAGVWSGNSNAVVAGSVTVSSFFASRALLLPLVIQQNPQNFRPSDRILLAVLTIIGNAGGLLVTWSGFEVALYKRQLLEAGFLVLGILNPLVFAGLTINLFRSPKGNYPAQV